VSESFVTIALLLLELLKKVQAAKKKQKAIIRSVKNFKRSNSKNYPCKLLNVQRVNNYTTLKS